MRTGEREKLTNKLWNPLKNHKGVTLIEVLVVIAILAVAVGGAGISISLATSRNAEKCARDINDGLENSRMLSLSKEGNFTLTIDFAAHEMTLHNEAPGTEADNVKKLQERVNISLQSDTEDLDEAASIEVMFDKSSGKVKRILVDGSEYSGDLIKIHTENDDGNRMANVVLVRNTGKHYVDFN